MIEHIAANDTAMYFEKTDGSQTLEFATGLTANIAVASSSITNNVSNTISTTGIAGAEVSTAVAVSNLIVVVIGY